MWFSLVFVAVVFVDFLTISWVLFSFLGDFDSFKRNLFGNVTRGCRRGQKDRNRQRSLKRRPERTKIDRKDSRRVRRVKKLTETSKKEAKENKN